MGTDRTESSGGPIARLPWGVKLGVALLWVAYGVAILTDTITDPIPNEVWAIIWFAVAGGLFVRTARLYGRS